MALVVRKKGSRRFDLPVEFPLTDCQGEFVNQDRRRLTDRRMEKYDHDALKILPTLYKLAFDLIDGVRSQSHKRP
jgi:hypothetical protein